MKPLLVEHVKLEDSTSMLVQAQIDETASQINQLNMANANPQISVGASLLPAARSGESSNPGLVSAILMNTNDSLSCSTNNPDLDYFFSDE
jgi:hypothetical protein